MLVFTEQELKKNLSLNSDVISVIEDGFTCLSNEEVVMPPIMRVDIAEQNGEVDIKSAYVKGKEMFAIKVSSGFFDNPKRGLPSGNGFMMLMSTLTGIPRTLLLDNGYLTEIRTAAAGAIAAKYLARSKLKTVGIIGAGSQARFQLEALTHVREFKQVLVYARSHERAHKYAKEMAAELNVEVRVAKSAEQVVRNSELIVTTTPSKNPLIQAEWLHPGLHITAMGADAEDKQELEAEILAAADKVICDSKVQCSRLGEVHHALETGWLKNDHSIIELGQLTSQQKAGREHDDQITVCDLTGTGVQDTAIALFAHKLMTELELGFEIPDQISLLKIQKE